MSSIDSAVNSALEIKAASTQQEIAYALLSKQQEAAKQQAAAALELLSSSAQTPSPGRAHGKGQSLDTYL